MLTSFIFFGLHGDVANLQALMKCWLKQKIRDWIANNFPNYLPKNVSDIYYIWLLLSHEIKMTHPPSNLIISIILLRLRRREHTILHQSPLKSSVHPLQAVRIPHAFQIFGRFEDPAHRIVNSNPNRMTPRCNCRGDPIGGFDRSH